MDNVMSTWWFSGLLIGAVDLAQDETAPRIARQTMAEIAADLTEHWSYDDNECRRVDETPDSKTAR